MVYANFHDPCTLPTTSIGSPRRRHAFYRARPASKNGSSRTGHQEVSWMLFGGLLRD
jgi:hypothetical protein